MTLSSKRGVRARGLLRYSMISQRLGRQADLFASTSDQSGPPDMDEPPPPDFVDRIRAELEATLALTEGAVRLPWKDLTQAILAEKRFASISNWLPRPEAQRLCAAFETQLVRLYAVEDLTPRQS